MKKIRFKIDYMLKYWNYLKFLRMKSILIFCQNLSLNAINDLILSVFLKDMNYKWKFLSKDIMLQLLNEKFLMKIRNFRKVLLLQNVKELVNVEKILKKNNVLILGYYMQNFFFFKKDFDVKKSDKKYTFENLKNRILIFFLKKKKLIFSLKFLFIKILLLLKKEKIN
jgi:hypothetical protein